MNTHQGYSKKKLDNTLVLLAGGGDKSLADFLGGIRISSSKIQYKTADVSASWTDLITLVNTDENVKQTPKTDNVNRPLMMINGGTATGELINTSIFSTGIYANAYTKMIIANGFVKAGSDSSHVLLGNGDHKALSDFAMASDYVKKIGDTMSGDLSFSNNASIKNAKNVELNDTLAFSGVINIVSNLSSLLKLSTNGSDNYIKGNSNLCIESTGNGYIDFDSSNAGINYTKATWNEYFQSLIVNSNKGILLYGNGNNCYFYAGTNGNPYKMEIGSYGVSYIQFNTSGLAKFYGDVEFRNTITVNNIALFKKDVTMNNNLSVAKTVTGKNFVSTATSGQPYATSSTVLNTNLNADLLDGIHASGLFTNFDNSGNSITATIGGTTKTFTVNYASNAGNATNVYIEGASGNVNYPLLFTTATSNSNGRIYSDSQWRTAGITFNPSSNTLNVGSRIISPCANHSQTSMRYLDAGLDSVSTDHNLYIGYGEQTYTAITHFYYSTGTTDSTSSRTEFMQINSNGAYALTRFGVNGQNTSYNFYTNGTAYISDYLRVTGGIARGNEHILSPAGGSYTSSSSSITGYIIIRFPNSLVKTMMSVWVDVYSFSTNKSFTVQCGAYTYSNSFGHAPFAMCIGAQHKIRYCYDDNYYYIVVAESDTSWSHPKFIVRDMLVGHYKNVDNWIDKSLYCYISTTLPGTETTSITRYAITTDNIGSQSVNYATSAGSATNANCISTVSTESSSNHYLTFVDSNNSSAAYEALYTNSDLYYKPNSHKLYINKLHTSSEIEVNGTARLYNDVKCSASFEVRGTSRIKGELYVTSTAHFQANIDAYDIYPHTKNTYDLGTPNKYWKELFVGGVSDSGGSGHIWYGKNWGGDKEYNFGIDGLIIYLDVDDSSGIQFNGDYINMWSPCDDYTLRYWDEDDGKEIWYIDNEGHFSGSAAELTTARTIWGQSFNGTANVSGSMSSVGNITSSSNNVYSIGTSTNKWKTIYATTFYGALSGNASTATKLATARTINGVSFDGSANITIAPSLLISGNTIASKVGNQTSTYITVPFATNATNADMANGLAGGVFATDLNATTLNANRIYVHNDQASNTPVSGIFGTVLQISSKDSPVAKTFDHWISQLDFVHNGDLYYRSNINTDNWTEPWKKVLTNYDLPVGTILMWATASIPAKWLICDGRSVPTDSPLRSLMTTTPNLSGRFPLGVSNSYSLGSTGGEATHTLTIAEMPSHNHTYQKGIKGRDFYAVVDDAPLSSWENDLTTSTGGSQPHNNMPPYRALYFIIKAY